MSLLLRLTLLLLLVAAANAALAANQATNPHFDTDTTGWSAVSCSVCTAPVLTWSSSDADSLASGSARVNNTIPSFGELGVDGLCAAVTPGVRYTFGARIFVPSASPRSGQAFVRIIWYGNADCTSFVNSVSSAHQYVGSEVVSHWYMDSVGAVAPANVHSARLHLSTYESGGNTTAGYVALFDNIYFDVERPPSVVSSSPVGGFPNNHVTVYGNDLYGLTRDSVTTGPSLRFNGTLSPSIDVLSDTRIDAVIPVGATTGPLSFTNASGTGASPNVFYMPPQVNSFAPAAGRIGSSVTIQGMNFTGTTNVRFGTSDATYVELSGTTVRATVPADTELYRDIQVVNASGIGGSSPTGFELFPPADFNLDRKDDLILRNYATGQNAIWFMNGANLLSVADLPALPNTNYRIEGTGDFNSDGHADLLLRNYSTGQNAVWLMNGATLVSVVDLPPLPNVDFHIEGTGDFNGDRKPDIILRNYVTGQNALWLMNDTTVASVVDLPALANPAYKIESCGDFNGDGDLDLVLRNYSTGQNALWLMNGTGLASVVDLPALPNIAYRIDAVADFNFDGRPDIVLRNYTTGQNAVWLMNGTSLSAIADLQALPNVSYEINGPR